MQLNDDSWFKLDNAGKLFPSIASYRCTTVFRISSTLTEPVNKTLLQSALNHLIKRIPYYQVQLKRGFFWYYLERVNVIPQIQEEQGYPCMYLDFRNNNFPYRFVIYQNRISLEMAHFLTDGTGALLFLKSLLLEYFNLKGIKCDDPKDMLLINDKIDKEEYEDGFKKYYQKIKTQVKTMKTAMHFPFPLTENGKYHVVTGIMDVKLLIEKAKSYKVTLTQFILALFYETIFDWLKTAPAYLTKDLAKPLTLNIPVNLRTIFPSKSMSNFFLSITPTLDPLQGYPGFEKTMSIIKKQMDEALDKNNLLTQLSRNIKGESSIFIRLMPLIIKDALMPFIYTLFGENGYTTSVSNVGKITMPEPLNDYIERFDFYPSPSRNNRIKTTVISFKDKLYFSFGKLTKITDLEKIFFRKLVKMGIPVKIETSY